MGMNEREIHALLTASGIDGVGGLEQPDLDPTVVLQPSALVEVMTLLRDDERLAMEMLHCVTAVDREDRVDVVYHVCSFARHHALTLRTSVAKPDDADESWHPEVPSVASVYAAADWHEREQWDLLGVHFTGHPDLRRLLLPPEWIGHPLRKDYVYPSEHGGIPLELDAVPIYERDEREDTPPVAEPRPAGTPLNQPPSAPSARPHAGGKAPAKKEGEG
ncbi:MAG: NADH-quinone oxidoreductase subunit C [Planctomycetota bacterium]|nr:MAG: NADH-quinone oxidoreductase subunit C [Planctomycetota bacterium]